MPMLTPEPFTPEVHIYSPFCSSWERGVVYLGDEPCLKVIWELLAPKTCSLSFGP